LPECAFGHGDQQNEITLQKGREEYELQNSQSGQEDCSRHEQGCGKDLKRERTRYPKLDRIDEHQALAVSPYSRCIDIAANMANGVIQKFILRKLTPSAKKQPQLEAEGN
jgi:hypothetical protein